MIIGSRKVCKSDREALLCLEEGDAREIELDMVATVIAHKIIEQGLIRENYGYNINNPDDLIIDYSVNIEKPARIFPGSDEERRIETIKKIRETINEQ